MGWDGNRVLVAVELQRIERVLDRLVERGVTAARLELRFRDDAGGVMCTQATGWASSYALGGMRRLWRKSTTSWFRYGSSSVVSSPA